MQRADTTAIENTTIKTDIIMTTEKKTRELGQKYSTPCHGAGDCEFEARQAAKEMAEWKESQMLEKAAMFFIDFFNELPDGPDKFKIKKNCSIEQLIESFNKAIKE